MSNERKMGFMWGIIIGWSTIESLILHPAFILISVVAAMACWSFGRYPLEPSK
jgi:hypothetical protein